MDRILKGTPERILGEIVIEHLKKQEQFKFTSKHIFSAIVYETIAELIEMKALVIKP